MPYKGQHEIIFPQDPFTNILLVHGENTYGKTSILRGIKWVLYGRVLDKRTQFTFLNLLNRSSVEEKDFEFEVEIKFEANEHIYVLTRNVKKNLDIGIPRTDSDFVCKTFFEKDGSVLSASELENEMNIIAPEPVSNFFLFDGELLNEYDALLKEEDDVSLKIKESIEQILGVPALVNGRNDTTQLLKEAQKRQKNELSKYKNIEEYANNRDEIQTKIDQSNKEIENFTKQIDVTNSKKLEIESSLQDIERQFKDASDIQLIKEKITLLKSQIVELEAIKLVAASKAWKVLLKNKLKHVQQKSLAQITDTINQFERVGAVKKEIELLNDIVKNNLCGICSANAPIISVEAAKANINRLNEVLLNISNDNSKFSKITNHYEIVNNLLGDGEERSLKDIDTELTNKHVQLISELGKEETLISKSGIIDPSEIKVKAEKIGNYNQMIQQNIKEIAKEKDKIESYTKQISSITRLIGENPGANESPTTKYVAIYDILNETFKESIGRLRDMLKEEVESKASEAFINLIHRKNYKKLKINNNYGLSIIDDENNLVDIRSSGASQIVALSLIDALARTGRPSGPVVMDTPFGRLDPKHRKNILTYLPESSSQLVLFVHRGETDKEIMDLIKPRIGSEYTIKLQKDGKNSMIEIGVQ
jgi:DNA sulfur modification protein DndD